MWMSLSMEITIVGRWSDAVLMAAWIIVRQQSTPFMSMPIDAEMNPRFDMVSCG